jgi:ribosome-associated toxin RatA of RatAB toxin-antitoxin module
MAQVKKTAEVPYSAQQMFELVNDVAQYPSFLPFCQAAQVLSSDHDHLEAQLTFAKGGLHKSFTTRNHLTAFQRMDVTLVDGPFKHLAGTWLFSALAEDQCRIDFELNYTFDSKMLAMMFGPLFSQVANSLVDCFLQQAKVVYGN